MREFTPPQAEDLYELICARTRTPTGVDVQPELNPLIAPVALQGVTVS
jgi:hypothetical protein